MGHIGTYGDVVYASQVENDIGLTTNAGTVTKVKITEGPFSGTVTNPKVIPEFSVPNKTSHLINNTNWNVGNIKTVKKNNTPIIPDEYGSVNISAPTKLSQLTGGPRAGYTTTNGTIEGITLDANSIANSDYTGGKATLHIAKDISNYTTNYGYYKFIEDAKKFWNYEVTTSGLNMAFDVKESGVAQQYTPTVSYRLVRYGKTRILYVHARYQDETHTLIKTNTEIHIGQFGSGSTDIPSSTIWNSNSVLNVIGEGFTGSGGKYYPVSILYANSNIYAYTGGSKTLSTHLNCSSILFYAMWTVDGVYN